ncbi:MAG: peptide deformylase [Parcubacteria group bacterium]|nr:peptide deformylase [Parcubacteria group bacterium]
MPIKIVQKDEPVLREIAKNIPLSEIKGAKIKRLIADMKDALYTCDDGIAIAAPQIDVPLRMFVVSGKIFYLKKETDKVSKDTPEPILTKKEKAAFEKKCREKDMVFINPEIIKLSKQKVLVPEGCLSVRWQYGNTYRAKQVRIRAYDEHGTSFEMGASGLLAQVFQHEIDHLNGILFIDHAKEIEEIKPDA